jgi:hypothetical protein
MEVVVGFAEPESRTERPYEFRPTAVSEIVVDRPSVSGIRREAIHPPNHGAVEAVGQGLEDARLMHDEECDAEMSVGDGHGLGPRIVVPVRRIEYLKVVVGDRQVYVFGKID